MNITEVSTIYFDQDALRLQPYKIGRVKLSESGRAYFKYQLPVKIYTSLTTVISTCTPMPYGIMVWKMQHGEKESKRMAYVAAMYGTLMHIEYGNFCVNQAWNFDMAETIVADYCSKNEFYSDETKEWPDRLKEDMQAFADFIFKYKVKTLAIEMVLCSDAFEFATAIDLVCMMTVSDKGYWGEKYSSGEKKGQDKATNKDVEVRAIVNFKSGRHNFYAENANQLELERMVWNENYPELPIDRVYNFAPTNWRDASGDKFKLADQTNKANPVEMEAMLMLASERYKGKNEQKVWTTIYGEVYYGNDPTRNVSQTKVVDYLEGRIKEYLSKV